MNFQEKKHRLRITWLRSTWLSLRAQNSEYCAQIWAEWLGGRHILKNMYPFSLFHWKHRCRSQKCGWVSDPINLSSCPVFKLYTVQPVQHFEEGFKFALIEGLVDTGTEAYWLFTASAILSMDAWDNFNEWALFSQNHFYRGGLLSPRWIRQQVELSHLGGWNRKSRCWETHASTEIQFRLLGWRGHRSVLLWKQPEQAIALPCPW